MKNRVCTFLCKCGFSLFPLPLFRNLDYTVFIFVCNLLQIFCLRWEEIILNKLLKTQSAPRIIASGFALVIFIGSLLLMLPCSIQPGTHLNYIDALYTSTSAVCVTGLTVVDAGDTFTALGQFFLAVLIQIGGLGVITAAVTFLMLSGKNISLKERSAMQDAISGPAVGGIVRLTRFVLMGTFLVSWSGLLRCCRHSAETTDCGACGWQYSTPFPPSATRGSIFWGGRMPSTLP